MSLIFLCLLFLFVRDVPCRRCSLVSKDESSNERGYGEEGKDDCQQNFWARSAFLLLLLLLSLIVQTEQIIDVDEADRDIGENPKYPDCGTSDDERVVVEDVVVVLEPCELNKEEQESSGSKKDGC